MRSRAFHRRVLGVLLRVVAFALALCPAPVRAEGLLEGISGDVESYYNFFTSRTNDPSGANTKSEISLYGTRLNTRLNYDVFPKLNLNGGVYYEKTFTNPAGDDAGPDSEVARFRPFVWLNLRDPVVDASVGYSLRDDTAKTSGQSTTSLTQDSYNARLTWRPTDLPTTYASYTRTLSRDDDRDFLDTVQDSAFLKSEYFYRGLTLHYIGTYLNTDNRLVDSESRQVSHEGRAFYSTTLLDGRIAASTDNRVQYLRFQNTTERPLGPFAGLSALTDTPLTVVLAPNSALIDTNRTASAGVDLGYPGLGGDFRRRNIGLDFLTAVEVNRLSVWVDGWGPDNLPADITSWFSWDIYISTDNSNWTFHATVAPGVFGPFDRRFELKFPSVKTRYIKVVTSPLPGGIIGSTNSSLYTSLFVTELEAFVDRTAQVKRKDDQLTQSYSFDIRTLLLRAPALYYTFSGYYYEVDTTDQKRYGMRHLLDLNHRFNPIWSTSASGWFEIGKDQGETQSQIRSSAALTATPLATLRDSLVVGTSRQWQGDETTTEYSTFLFNSAQLYRGIDVDLNLGATFRSEERDTGGTVKSRDLQLTVGTRITPHPALSLTSYYTGTLGHRSGGDDSGSGDTTQHRLDLSLSLNPFPSLFLSASANVSAGTDQDTTVQHNYGLSFAPFPGGNLQFNVFYSENYVPDHSRTVQPSVRWYLTSRRRAYVDASYQYSTSDVGDLDQRSHLISTSLKVYF